LANPSKKDARPLQAMPEVPGYHVEPVPGRGQRSNPNWKYPEVNPGGNERETGEGPDASPHRADYTEGQAGEGPDVEAEDPGTPPPPPEDETHAQ
jgi:hypothetical protein